MQKPNQQDAYAASLDQAVRIGPVLILVAVVIAATVTIFGSVR